MFYLQQYSFASLRVAFESHSPCSSGQSAPRAQLPPNLSQFINLSRTARRASRLTAAESAENAATRTFSHRRPAAARNACAAGEGNIVKPERYTLGTPRWRLAGGERRKRE